MKIIRWLLSHFFLILLIVIVIYGYMFWGNLAGENTPAGKVLAYLSSEFVEVEEFINAVKAKQAQLSAEKHQPSASRTENRQLTASSDSNKTAADKANITQQPVSISYSYNQMRIKQSSDGDIESLAELPSQDRTATASTLPDTQPESQPVEQDKQVVEPAPAISQEEETAESETPPLAVPDITTAPDKFVSTEVEQQLDNVDKNGNVINKPLAGDAIRESWITARKSFYQRRYELSEQSYRDVIENTTDNFDAYGELGNVYFNQGKNEAAAKAYFEAAAILVRKGQVRRARSLMGLLRHLDESRAIDLQKLIDSAVS